MATFAEHKKILKDIQAFKPQLEKVVDAMGVLAANHFTTSFRNQGFTDEGLKRWQARKGEISGGIAKTRGRSRAILVQSGRLRRSIRTKRFGFLAVKILTDVPYAQMHNDGGIIYRKAHKRSSTITAKVRGSSGFVNGVWKKGRSKTIKLKGASYNVGASSFKMPKRQFIGYSGVLNRKIIAKMDVTIKRIFNK